MTERKATCPNCGAEIVFRWSGAIQTTCPACRSILVRHDIDLRKVGTVGDVPASMSGIQLGTEGRFKTKPFVVVGRIIYNYELGHWNEWHIRFADDTSAWLSDAQAEYAVSSLVNATIPPNADQLGEAVHFGTREFTLMSITRASYAGVEGELPFEYWDKTEVRFRDYRGDGDSFATVDETETPPLLFIGEYEAFEELRLKNLREDADQPSGAEPKSKGFNCASCGAAIVLRTGDVAQNVVCSACGSVIDARDPNFAILQGHQANMHGIKPEIPLGSVCQIKGKSWQVIGYQIRGITVDGEIYKWSEYLLWNAEGGFRYLSEYDGHWNEISTVKGLPKEVSAGPPMVVEYAGTQFKHFQGAKAKTYFVLGEFPWQVRVGDIVVNDDFVAPPMMLSRERTPEEITWSLGTYTTPDRIREAFKLKEELPTPKGVYSNQPNPLAGRTRELGGMFFLFACALLVLFVARHITARNEQVFSQTYNFQPASGDTAAFVTPVFDLAGGPSNVQVLTVTNLANDWAFLNLALLPEGGGSGYEMGREISFYSGIEDGESWTEGSQSDRVLLPAVPGGKYYLRIDPEGSLTNRNFSYSLTVKRDVPRSWPFLVVFGVLALPVILVAFREQAFERARWAESDYAPSTDNDDDE